jgi:HD domain
VYAARSGCEVSAALGERLGIGPAAISALDHVYERWDGRGIPDGRAGEEVQLVARVVHVAEQAVLAHFNGGQAAARSVAEFFAAVGELEIHDFQVLDILASERQVAVEVVIDFSTPAGGRSRDEELHLWTLNDHEQVTRLRHYVDTAKHIAAFAGEDTTT